MKEIIPIGKDLRITEDCVSGRDIFRKQDGLLNKHYYLVCVIERRDGVDVLMTL
jgi:hypothetical protein